MWKCALIVAFIAFAGGRATAGDPFVEACRFGDLEKAKALAKVDPKILTSTQPDDKLQNTPLHVAAANNQVEVIKWLLGQGVPVDSPNAETSTPLHVASYRGKVEAVEALLAAGADPEARTEDGYTPVILAGYSAADPAIFDVFARRNVRINQAAGDGTTALHMAIFGGHVETMAYLVKHGLDVNAKRKQMPPLTLPLLVHHGELPVLTWMIENGADPYVACEHRETVLHDAAAEGYEEALEMLLEHGVRPDVRGGHWNITPLFLAIKTGRVSCARLLLKHGADPNQRMTIPWERDITILHASVFFHCHEGTMVLLNHGADPLAKNGRGETALDMARRLNCERGIHNLAKAIANPNPDWPSQKKLRADAKLLAAATQADADTIEKLLADKADLDARDKGLNTPLHLAAERGSLRCAALLLEAKASPQARNRDNETPLHVAVRLGRHRIARAILAAGGYPGPRDIEFDTPLHVAAERGDAEMVRLLLEAKANPNARNRKGLTPADVATGAAAAMLTQPTTAVDE